MAPIPAPLDLNFADSALTKICCKSCD